MSSCPHAAASVKRACVLCRQLQVLLSITVLVLSVVSSMCLENRNRLINSLQVKTFRALYDNPQWENSILVTPQRIFLNQEYSSTIAERLLTTPRWKNLAVFTQNTLESLLLRLCLSLRQHHWRRKKHHNTCKIFDPYAQTATSAKEGRYNIWRHNGQLRRCWNMRAKEEVSSFSNCKTSTSTSDFAEATDWPFPTPHRKIQKTSKRKYAASLIIMDYGSPSKPTNRPSTSETSLSTWIKAPTSPSHSLHHSISSLNKRDELVSSCSHRNNALPRNNWT